MQHIFLDNHQAVLCYSPKDRRLMRHVVDDLKREGVILWTGDYLKPSGDYWLTSLHQALDASNTLFVLLTPDTSDSATVQQAIAYAREKSIPIYLLLTKGNLQSTHVPRFGDSSLIDLRRRVEGKESLAAPEVITAATHPRPTAPQPYLYWNPVDQLRLFFAMFWHPDRVRHSRHDRQLTNLKRTGGWLVITMFVAILLIFAIGDVVEDPSLRSFSRILLITVPSLWSGQFFETVTWWNFLVNAIAVGIGTILLLLATLLLIDIEDASRVGIAGLVFFIVFPLLGGIAGGIAEAFQSHRLVIFLFSLVSAYTWGAVAISLIAHTVVSGVGTGVGGISILMLLGSLFSITAIVIMYLLLFLVADSLIRTLFLNKRSTVSRAVPTVAIACYALLLLTALF